MKKVTQKLTIADDAIKTRGDMYENEDTGLLARIKINEELRQRRDREKIRGLSAAGGAAFLGERMAGGPEGVRRPSEILKPPPSSCFAPLTDYLRYLVRPFGSHQNVLAGSLRSLNQTTPWSALSSEVTTFLPPIFNDLMRLLQFATTFVIQRASARSMTGNATRS